MCWFEWGDLDVARARRRRRAGSGSWPARCRVHADGEPGRLPVYRRAVAAGTVPPGWAADDGVGLLFRGTELAEVVSSRPSAGARRVGPGDERPVQPRRLGRRDRVGPTPEIAEFRRVRRSTALRGGR